MPPKPHSLFIIHAAWPVNFNHSLPSFEPSITGLVALIQFANTTPLKPHLHYVWSISSVISKFISSPVAERIITSLPSPLPNGYAESKHISELLLAYAADKLHISVSVSRVGQIVGAVEQSGLWNLTEWFPGLVLCSLHLCAIPESLGEMNRIDFVPVDLLAGILVEFAAKEEVDRGGWHSVFHPVHPHPTTWSTVRPWVISALGYYTEKELKVVSGNEWLDLVRKVSPYHLIFIQLASETNSRRRTWKMMLEF
jgi:thioester reductase-like protein